MSATHFVPACKWPEKISPVPGQLPVLCSFGRETGLLLSPATFGDVDGPCGAAMGVALIVVTTREDPTPTVPEYVFIPANRVGQLVKALQSMGFTSPWPDPGFPEALDVEDDCLPF